MDVSAWARVSLDKAFTAEAYVLLLALEQIEKEHIFFLFAQILCPAYKHLRLWKLNILQLLAF